MRTLSAPIAAMICLLGTTAGCKSANNSGQSRAADVGGTGSASTTDQAEAQGHPPGASSASAQPAEKATLRCDAFFSKAELTALGFDTAIYDPEGTTGYMTDAVACPIGSASYQVHWDGRYDDGIRKGFEQAWASDPSTKQGIEVVDGPKYGSDTLWMNAFGSYQVHFVDAKSGRSAIVLGDTKEDVEKLAEALLAKL